jgi:cation diffusion facilitator family transporter
VLVGVVAVVLTGWERLDPIIALLVAANIVWTGAQLVRRSALGLLDTALPQVEPAAVLQILERYTNPKVQFHALRSRQAGVRRFVSLHVLVPGAWTVHQSHMLLEQIERDIRAALPNVTVFTHLESLDDPASWQDMTLDRAEAPADASEVQMPRSASARH